MLHDDTTRVLYLETVDDLRDTALEPRMSIRERRLMDAARLAIRQLAGNMDAKSIRSASALAWALEAYRGAR